MLDFGVARRGRGGWFPAAAAVESGQFSMRPFDPQPPLLISFPGQERQRLLEARVLPGAVVKREDVDVIKKVVAEKGKFDLQEEGADTELAGTDRPAHRPVVEQGVDRPVETRIIAVFRKAKRVESEQGDSRIGVFSLRSPAARKLQAAPAAVVVHCFQQMGERAPHRFRFHIAEAA